MVGCFPLCVGACVGLCFIGICTPSDKSCPSAAYYCLMEARGHLRDTLTSSDSALAERNRHNGPFVLLPRRVLTSSRESTCSVITPSNKTDSPPHYHALSTHMYNSLMRECVCVCYIKVPVLTQCREDQPGKAV